ncbi:MAG: MBL fold metallo-hydrolase [Gammaproteobacteria bacterium]|nr:MBL fold metallo-hydrolase [Gammaproteobacteria bacterium]MDH5777522.1 MBL fold metallo-hydrolase [Gammaproteobacteria bacterium]
MGFSADNEAIEIVEGIYWIGFYDDESKLNSNPYLIVDDDEAVLIDPGSVPDFPIVMRKIIDIINPEKISTIIAAHQDPDVCGNLPVMEDVIANDDLIVAAHSVTQRLIYHYGLKSQLYCVDENNYRLTLKSGRELQFIYTAYLHSPGAIATYDPETKSLFTSDIFGSLSKSTGLYAGDDFPHSMNKWHQSIMPANKPLRDVMGVFKKMDIDRILPQHGSLIPKQKIGTAIAYLEKLPCGFDLINQEVEYETT